MPEEFGRYQLIELLGRGGMGEVYRAQDTVHDRVVALKVLPDYLAGDESFETRFRRESRMAAKLNEPHIIPIHDFGEIGGRLFIDMRLVEGHDLGSVLQTHGTLPVHIAVELVAQTASALDAAHASGLVHRDVKPSNILLTGLTDKLDIVPFAYLVDFGIARSSAQEGTALTATTATVGTVAYMSPERISGAPSDLRTDVYALACVLYETLTGRKPFEGEMFAQMYAHLNTPAPTASDRRSEVPARLDDVIARGMAKNPDERFLSAGALASAARSALRDAARTDTVRGRPSDFGPAPADAARSGVPSGSVQQPPPPPPRTPPPVAAAQSGGWTPPPPPRTDTRPELGSGPGPGGGPGSGPVRGPGTGPGSGPGSTPPLGDAFLPPVLPTPPDASGRSRRTALIAAAVVVVLALGAVIAFVASRGGGSPSADPSGTTTSGSAPASTSPGTTTAAAPVLSTGSPGTPAVSWAHFAAFTKLVGTSDGDTTGAFSGGSCTVARPGSSDAEAGVEDEVTCSYSGSSTKTTVARFATAAQVQTYLHDQVKTGFRELVWTSTGQPRGLTLISPRSGSGAATLATSICGLPTYLVRISAPDRTETGTLQLHDDYWAKATFPDAVPPTCNSTFDAVQTGSTTAPSVGPAKDVLTMNSSIIEALVEQGDTTLPVVQVPTATGVQALAVGQKGSVTFWSEVDDVLQLVGRSTYPYSSSLGAPEAQGSGAVLTGMADVTFVVRGTFSGDGSGNAVAYTNGSKGWGAIKAQSDGSLKPSGQGVTIGGIGLGDDFQLVGGRLQTFDCSSQLPIAQCSGNDRVIKYWTWRTSRFVQTGSAGRSR